MNTVMGVRRVSKVMLLREESVCSRLVTEKKILDVILYLVLLLLLLFYFLENIFLYKSESDVIWLN